MAPLAWSTDGRYIAARHIPTTKGRDAKRPGIYLIPTNGGEPRAITQPKPSATDQAPAFSPDGSQLAYSSCEGFFSCYVYIVRLDEALVPRSAPRQVTTTPFFDIDSISMGSRWEIGRVQLVDRSLCQLSLAR